MASRSYRLPLLNPDVYSVSVMDFVFYPGYNKVQSVHPFLTAMTGTKGLVFCFCQHSKDVLSLGLHAVIESSDAAGCNDVL